MLMISDEQRRWRMAQRHRLLESGRADDIASIADDLIGLHSSDPATVYLSALIRMKSPSIEAIDGALYDDRTVVRHHAMRRTIWVMTPEVARLAHGAATAKIAAAERRRTSKALEHGTEPGVVADAESWLDAALAQVADLLRVGAPLATRLIGKELPELTIPVVFGVNTKNPGSLRAHTKVLQGGGFDGRFVRGRPTGAWTSSEYEWHLTEQWLGQPLAGLDEGSASAALLRRWLPRFGPATETDIRWWFGWTATLARASLAADAGPIVMVDGECVGPWAQPADGTIVYELSRPLDSVHRKLLDTAVDELAASVGDAVVKPRFPTPGQKALL